MPQQHQTDWDRDAALTTARILLEIKAVNFRPEEPYTFTSGWKSPVYIDCRRIIYFPRARAKICALGVEKIGRHIGFETIEAVAGGETAGIPFAAWIADRMMAPMAYVRKKPKGFGRNALIEGDVPEGKQTLLVEDLTTDGRSKIQFAQALRDAGAIVNHTFVVFFYGVFRAASRRWRKWASRCTACVPGGTCWRPAASGHTSPSPPWRRCGVSWKTPSPGRPPMAASRVRRKRWPAAPSARA